MVCLQRAVDAAGLEPLLLELVKMRASQINGWNRLAISLRAPVGEYVSPHRGTSNPSDTGRESAHHPNTCAEQEGEPCQ